MADNIPKKNHKIADETLDETEVITRIMWVMHNFHIFDLENFDWNVKYHFRCYYAIQKPMEEQGIDSLETTALLTSIEHEFHTVFEDRVFENMETLN